LTFRRKYYKIFIIRFIVPLLLSNLSFEGKKKLFKECFIMKICKKILAGVLVFAMMLSMCAFVSADDVTEPAVTSKLVSRHAFDGETVGKVVTQTGTSAKTFAKEAGSPAGGAFYLKSKANDGSATVVAKAEGDNYISSDHTYMGYNHRVSNVSGVSGATSDYVTLGYGEDFPVLHTGYDIMIPADDPYRENERTFTLPMGTTAEKSYGSNVTSAVVHINEGKVSAGASASAANKSGAYKYTYGEWLHIDVYAWVTGEMTMDVATFANDNLIYWGTKTVAEGKKITGMATDGISFRYNNDKANSTILATYDDTTVDENAIKSITNYDNIIVELLPISSVANVPTEKLSEYVVLLDFDTTKLATTADVANKGTYDAETGVLTGVAKASLLPLVKSKAVFTVDMVQSSSTTAVAEYKIDTTKGRAALSATSTDAKRVYSVANVRKSLKEYINDGNDKTLIYSYDMYIPAGTEAVERKVGFGFGYDVGSGSNDRKSSDITFETSVKNGIITIDAKGLNFGKTIDKRSETRAFTSDAWHTVTYIIDICWDAEAKVYNATVYGTFDEDVICKSEIVLKDVDDDEFSTAGVFDNLTANTLGVDAVPPTGYTEEFSTLYSNIFMELDNNFDRTAIDFDAWVERRIEMSKDASENIDVYAKETGVTFDDEILVIAICNAKGYVKEIITSDVIAEDGTFSYKIPAAKVEAGNIVKAFVFDSIASAKPQMPSGKYIVK